MKIFSLIIAGLLLAVAASARADLEAEKSDSGITGPKYSVQLERMDLLRAQYPHLVNIIDYGTSVRGRTLRLMLVKRGDFPGRRPAVFMSGATHGNEYLNIEDRVPEKLLEQAGRPGSVSAFLGAGGVFVFVPIMNPDGYDFHLRENANGVDLNRDWDLPPAGYKGFKEIESKKLAEILAELERPPENLQYKITVDYHCCIGALLHPWSFTKNKLVAEDVERHQQVGEMARKLLGVQYGPTGDVLGYYPVGTTKDYFYHHYNSVAFTYEGRRAEENQHLAAHVKWWEQIVASIASELPQPLFSLKINPRKRGAIIAD